MFSNKIKKAAKDLQHFIQKKTRYNKDLLSEEELDDVEVLSKEVQAFSKKDFKKNDTEAQEEFAELEKRALKLFPINTKNVGIIENVEVFFVAIVLALALRSYVLQPFKIPTHSMRPTLWGISAKAVDPSTEKPNVLIQLKDAVFHGTTHHRVVVQEPGKLKMNPFGEPIFQQSRLFGIIPFLNETSFQIGKQKYKIWGSIGDLQELFKENPDLFKEIKTRRYEKGDVFLNYTRSEGDHIFVNKIAYHFRRPNLGEVFVFSTENIRRINQSRRASGEQVIGSQYYIKRCVGTEGDTLEIKQDDPHLYVNGEILGTGLKNDYIFFDGIYSMDNGYHGYVYGDELGNGLFLTRYNPKYTIPDRSSWAMGDNSRNSSDSRAWGRVPDDNLVGTAFIVHWPFTKRWGLIK
ncbi:MAG: signal peptidase I [Verrucomicrobiota bacterium]